jgi:hypothetical protein
MNRSVDFDGRREGFILGFLSPLWMEDRNKSNRWDVNDPGLVLPIFFSKR